MCGSAGRISHPWVVFPTGRLPGGDTPSIIPTHTPRGAHGRRVHLFWDRVWEVFHAALDHQDEREAFVAGASHGDERVAREVLSLLAAHERTGILPRSLDDLRGDSHEGLDLIPRLSAALEGRYTVERELGRGGMAFVFLARDRRHERAVAIKVVRPDVARELGAERFLAEIRVTANLHHPNILPLFESGEAGPFIYYVMPYVAGESLRDRLRREGELATAEVLRIAGAVASALDYAHGQGVVHRDIKPENILLRGDDTFVADFGIALALATAGDRRLTAPGASIGTPAYMAPEQVDGEAAVDGRADVYALGCVAYEMLAGEPPFVGRVRTVMLRHLRDPAPPISTLRPAFGTAVDGVMATALAKSPADRHRTAGAFLDGLRAALGRETVAGGAAASPRAPAITHRTPADWKHEQEIRFCRTQDGVSLAYAVSGAGIPLIKSANWLSHVEFDAQSPVWRHWWAALSARFRFIRYDERGCGLSDRNPQAITFDDWVADLEAVVDAAGLERFVLLGVSKGGAIATAYAARHPERVSHLIIHGAFALSKLRSAEDEAARKRVLLEVEMVRLGWGQNTPAYRQAFTTMFYPGASPDQMDWFNELQRVSASPEVAARIMEASYTIDVREEARRVTTPTLVLHSTDDARVPFAAGRQLASLIPGARFVPLDSRNHIPLEHEPAWQRFVDEIYAFTGVG
jgi:serine/threonine protein kinase/pimeloyl-ACP methyl ester carboxylesterase